MARALSLTQRFTSITIGVISGFQFHMDSVRFVSLEVLVTLCPGFCVGNNTNMDLNPNRNLAGLSSIQKCVIIANRDI